MPKIYSLSEINYLEFGIKTTWRNDYDEAENNYVSAVMTDKEQIMLLHLIRIISSKSPFLHLL